MKIGRYAVVSVCRQTESEDLTAEVEGYAETFESLCRTILGVYKSRNGSLVAIDVFRCMSTIQTAEVGRNL